MSDLYLVLRSRLESVTDWVTLGADVMKAARTRKGLSHESIARLIPVSSKTYERYEKQGRVPRHLLPLVADALGLEIEEPALQRVTVSLAGGEERLDRIEARLEEVLGLVREMRSPEADSSAGAEG